MAKKRLIAADLFCGAGGSSTGLMRASQVLGRKVELVAVNHWDVAVETHSKNHPQAHHYCEDLTSMDPKKAVPSGRLDLLIAAPECTHHSVARGGKPMNDQSRASAWCILRWATALRVERILIENVREFTTWGPLGANGRPLKSRRGETFAAFVNALESLGYHLEMRVLNAADYGDATTRQRLFIQAALGRRPIRWPKATHISDARPDLFEQIPRWRAARSVIDWRLPGDSIFSRKRPLSANTLKRIEAGLRKFGGKAAEPFLVAMNYLSSREHDGRHTSSVDKPVPTITSQGNRFGLVQPYLVNLRGTDRASLDSTARDLDEPVPVITASGEHVALCEPFLMHTTHHGGERISSLDRPMPTVTGANRGEQALVQPFIMSAGGPRVDPRSVDQPMNTILTRDHMALVEPFIVPTAFGERDGQAPRTHSLDEPLPTIVGSGGRLALTDPFVVKYNGTGGAHPVSEPLDTISTRDRFGLVEVDGMQLDIRFRMLAPHELAGAMGFPSDYKFAGNRGDQVKQIGNAIAVGQAAALCAEMISD